MNVSQKQPPPTPNPTPGLKVRCSAKLSYWLANPDSSTTPPGDSSPLRAAFLEIRYLIGVLADLTEQRPPLPLDPRPGAIIPFPTRPCAHYWCRRPIEAYIEGRFCLRCLDMTHDSLFGEEDHDFGEEDHDGI